MKTGRGVELECPRCRQIATRGFGRQTHCTYCGAELVESPGPSEAWVRAYLYADGGGSPLQLHALGKAEVSR